MDDQRLAVVQADQQVLGAPVDAGDGAALDLGGELRRQRDPEVAAALLQADDAPADQARASARAGRFLLQEVQACAAAVYSAGQ